MTVLELHNHSQYMTLGRAPTTDLFSFSTPSEPVRMSLRQCEPVLMRNSDMTVVTRLHDGGPRFLRERYRAVDGVIYLAASAGLGPLIGDSVTHLECDVSDVEGLRVWRYLTVSGIARLLQPTGAEEERSKWMEGVEGLRSAVPDLPPTQELRFANFGVVRVDVVAVAGWMVRLDLAESPESLPQLD